MIQINKRSIGICILLPIITCGIYGIYWMYLLVKNTRSIQKNTDKCTGEMLCLIFVPFYSLYWWYTRGEKVRQGFAEHDYNATGGGVVYLVLAIFGLSIVSMAIMQSDFNSLKSETHSEQRSTFKNKVNEKTAMLIARITVIVIAVVGIVIAWDKNSSVFQIVSFAWAGFGAAFGPVMLMSLFWKRTTKWGAFAGILAGGVMVFVWKFLVRPLGGLLDIYELLPAFIVALVAIVVVSLIDKKPSAEICDEFDSIKTME